MQTDPRSPTPESPVQAAVSSCSYNPRTRRLRAKGWCFPPPTNVILRTAHGVIGEASVGVPRPDLANRFPDAEDLALGWVYSGYLLDEYYSEEVIREAAGRVEVETWFGGREIPHTKSIKPERDDSLSPPPVHRIIGCWPSTLRRRLAQRGLYLTRNDRRLAGYRNRHAGERAFLLGNGPSVRQADLERMNGSLTFAANRFYKAYPDLGMRPTYTCCSDLLVLERSGEAIARECGTPLFVSERSALTPTLRRNYPNVITFQESDAKIMEDPNEFLISSNPLLGIGFGFGIIYVMVQLAMWMGVKEICLYGIDHTFVLPTDFQRPGTPVTYEGEQNHFIRDYREPGEKWAPPAPRRIEAGFIRAKRFCEAHGVSLWNCTRGGKLEVLGRKPLDHFLVDAV